MDTQNTLQIATFKTEVTPPVGHPLCAGWYDVAKSVSDSLWAGGVILSDGGLPIVLCAVDWCEISNRSHIAWKQALADAVGTTPDRVSVHCVHPHCTPWPDEYAQSLVEAQPGVLPIMDAAWCAAAMQRVAAAAHHALQNRQPVTHLATGRARVEQVASNRRIMGEDGKIKAVRWTTTRDSTVRAEPEGLIDPFLKTISFWNGEEKLAALHYYAVHPSSYDDGVVSPDFTGLAREKRNEEDSGVLHLYFTECAGNITAGKYNDGAKDNRALFTERIYLAMLESERQMQRIPFRGFEWRVSELSLPPREDMIESDLMRILQDGSQPSATRGKAALMLAYLERSEKPIEVAALHFAGDVSLLHLPAEAFIEYQIFAQQQRPHAFVVAPAYGDCGPGYICMKNSQREGGYEPTDSFVSGECEQLLKTAIANVMAASGET